MSKPKKTVSGSAALDRAIVESSVDGMLVLDMESGRFDYANPAILRMFGYSAEEFSTLSLASLHPELSRVVLTDRFETLAPGETALAPETPCLRKDGSAFHADIHATRTLIAGRERVCCQFRDISERKRADEDLREREERYRAIVESIGDALFIHDIEGRIIDVNDSACRLYGYSREELVGANLLSLGSSPSNLGVQKERFARLRRDGEIRFEHAAIRRDGVTVATDVYAKLVSREGRGIVHGFVRDISERKRLEEALRAREEGPI